MYFTCQNSSLVCSEWCLLILFEDQHYLTIFYNTFIPPEWKTGMTNPKPTGRQNVNRQFWSEVTASFQYYLWQLSSLSSFHEKKQHPTTKQNPPHKNSPKKPQAKNIFFLCFFTGLSSGEYWLSTVSITAKNASFLPTSKTSSRWDTKYKIFYSFQISPKHKLVPVFSLFFSPRANPTWSLRKTDANLSKLTPGIKQLIREEVGYLDFHICGTG